MFFILNRKAFVTEQKKLRWLFLEQLYWKYFTTRLNISMRGTKQEIYGQPNSEIHRALMYLQDKKWIEMNDTAFPQDFPDEISLFITALGIDIVEDTLLKRE